MRAIVGDRDPGLDPEMEYVVGGGPSAVVRAGWARQGMGAPKDGRAKGWERNVWLRTDAEVGAPEVNVRKGPAPIAGRAAVLPIPPAPSATW